MYVCVVPLGVGGGGAGGAGPVYVCGYEVLAPLKLKSIPPSPPNCVHVPPPSLQVLSVRLTQVAMHRGISNRNRILLVDTLSPEEVFEKMQDHVAQTVHEERPGRRGRL